MKVVRLGRTVGGLCAAMMLAACGGGGGGGGSSDSPAPPVGGTPGGTPPGTSNPAPGTKPTFAVANKTITFLSPIPNIHPESQRIEATISGAVTGQLYILQSISDDGAIARASMNYSSTSGQTPTIEASVDPRPPSQLLPGTYTSTITFTACVDDSTCQTGQLPGSPQTINVTYTIGSNILGDTVGPRVVTAGETGNVILHGTGFTKATTVSFGAAAGTNVSVSSLAPDSELRATYPALTPGTYPIAIDSGAVKFTGSLIVVAPANYAAAKLTYPSAPQEIGGMLYDAQRQALYVAARYTDSQANKLFKFQFSAGTWQAPVSVPVPSLQDVALSLDGATLLLLTDTALTEYDVATLTRGTSYSPTDPLITAGTSYMQSIAVAGDGFAVVTTGGVNPSNVLLYSTFTRTFFTINTATGNSPGFADPRLYFGNPGVSADGAVVAVAQDPRTAANNAFLYLYTAAEVQRGLYFGIPSSRVTDKDRSQFPRSAKPAVNHRAGVVSGTRMVVNGSPTVVLDAAYSPRGVLPDTTRAAVFKPDASRVYTFDAAAGTEDGQLRSYNVGIRLTLPDQMYPAVGTPIPMSLGSGTGAIAMTITPDGGTVFVVGTSAIYVQPSPP